MLSLNFSPFPNLSTERLFLRQLKMEDVSEIFAIRSNERVNQFLERPKANSIADARAFIEKINHSINNNESVMWAITYINEKRLIGTIVYWNISPRDSRAEIGFELNPDFHGKGIMQEALSKVIEFGFTTMKLKVVEAYVHFRNTSSIKLLEKMDFKKDTTAHSGQPPENLMEVYMLHNKTS